MEKQNNGNEHFYTDLYKYKTRVDFYLSKLKECTTHSVEEILMKAVRDEHVTDTDFFKIISSE